MLKKNKVKTTYVTHKDLAEQTQIILGAIDGRFNKVDGRFNKVDDRFNKLEVDLREELHIVRNELKSDINDVREELSAELYRVRDELKTDINDGQISLDGYVKAQEDFKQEFVIMKEEIRQIKQVFKQKLGVEIRAF